MLIAFHNGTPDKDGSQFASVHAMIGDAWDVRAVRKLEEMNLLKITHPKEKVIGAPTIWNITDKGTLIALAIMEDANSLSQIQDRDGLNQYRIINSDANRRLNEKKARRAA